MSVDKLVDSTQLDADLTSVANAIRTKGGTSASLAFPSDFVSAIAAIPSGGGIPIESGTFTVPTKERYYDIIHSLGVVPNFVFIYPVSVSTGSDTYLIASEFIVGDFGQADWTIGTNATKNLSRHGIWQGTGYNVSVNAAKDMGGLPKHAGGFDNDFAGVFTSTMVRVGNFDGTTGSGWLLGTYGYVLGVLPDDSKNI